MLVENYKCLKGLRDEDTTVNVVAVSRDVDSLYNAGTIFYIFKAAQCKQHLVHGMDCIFLYL